MPGFDRTGPQGAGPRTGRGMGNCSGYSNPDPAAPARFYQGNRGAGRGWRHRFFATGIPGWVPPTAEQETADLKTQAEFLQSQLDAIQKRLDELTSK